MTFAVSENGNPFPGLRSFERDQAHLFFGREQQIKDLLARLRVRRFLPIVGVSGSGKSSLVRAGLIPTLTGSYVGTDMSGWRIVLFRPGGGPMQELAETLCREFAVSNSDAMLEVLRGSNAGLARVAQEHLEDGEKLLVLVDQFEELFRYGDEANAAGETNEAAAFVKLLLAAAGQSEHPLPGFDNLPVYVVTTMRSDFLGKCSQFRGLPEALNQSQYLIPRLTREEQRDAIEGPVEMANGSIEPALVQRLLNDLGDNPDQLPALQHALMRTWEQSATALQGKAMSVANYEAIGGMAEALNRDADWVYDSLPDDQSKKIARRIFKRLVLPGAPDSETRAPTPQSELIGVTAADQSDVKRVIDIFEKRGFLTVSGDNDPIIDIPHESLIRGWRKLTGWVEEEFRSAATYRRLVDTALLHSQIGVWLVDPELQLTLNWRKDATPNEVWAARYDSRFAQAIEFLEKSQKEQQAKQEQADQKRRHQLKLFRVIALLFATISLVAIVSAIFAASQLARIRTERDRSNRLFYDSNVYSAGSAVASGQITLAQDRLAEVLDANLRELRGFEWFYLWRASHADRATLTGHKGGVMSVAFSPDGKTLASASKDDTVKLWDSATGKEVNTISAIGVLSIAFSPDGKTLATGHDDRTVKLWDLTTRKEMTTFSGHLDSVRYVAFSPDGKTLATASNDEAVNLWDIATGKVVATLLNDTLDVVSVAFSPDGKTLASTSSDGTVTLWDITTHKQVSTLSRNSDHTVLSVAFSPDGKMLASSQDQTVKLWDTVTRKEMATLAGHTGLVTSVAFSPDGKTLASASQDRTVKLWDTVTRKEIATLVGHTGWITSVAFSPDGKTLASVSWDRTVKLWDTTATSLRNYNATNPNDFYRVRAVTFSPDSKILASASENGTVGVWDTSTLKVFAKLNPSNSEPFVAFSPDGQTLAFAGTPGTVELWDTATHTEVATLSGHSDTTYSVAFSPDGKILAQAGTARTVNLWDTATHTEVATLSGHSRKIFSVAFSPDGKTLASGSEDETVKLWDIATRREVLTLSGHSDSIICVAFSPDGKILASASWDNTVKLWNTTTGKEVASLSGHSNGVTSVAFSPDGKTLASGSPDKTVKLWDTASHKEVATLSGHSDMVWCVAFSPDGKILASASADGTVKLWLAATAEEVDERRHRDAIAASPTTK